MINDYDIKSGTLTYNLGRVNANVNSVYGTAYIDTLGYGPVVMGVAQRQKSNGDGNFAITIIESDDPTFATFDTVPEDRLDTGTYDTLSLVGENNFPQPAYYRKVQVLCSEKRYMQMVITATNVTVGTVIGTIATVRALYQQDKLNEEE